MFSGSIPYKNFDIMLSLCLVYSMNNTFPYPTQHMCMHNMLFVTPPLCSMANNMHDEISCFRTNQQQDCRAWGYYTRCDIICLVKIYMST